jgi:transcriptional regulatory protein RtcR
MASKPLVVIGLLGSTLDAGFGSKRWDRWRPTVSVCQHPDLLVRRFELVIQPAFQDLARTVAADLRMASPETEVRVHSIEFKNAWDFQDVYGALHDFARGYPFDPEKEDYLVHITTGTHVAQICLFLLTESRYFPGRLLQTSPPKGSDKPSYSVIDLDLSKYDRLASRFRLEQRAGLSFLKGGIDTRNPAFNRLIESIEQVAIGSRDPILLHGPTGAGKSLLAKRIYDLKKQRRQLSGAFVEVNCAMLRGDAALSALFGHARGAFTGAQSARSGHLLKADGGLLLLDEIGELGLDEQAMLLRAIEERAFFPLGSDEEVHSNFQLIAGTNRDLGGLVREGRFREDLLARINLWTFRLPALRDRKEDLEPNFDFELERFAQRSGIHVTCSREARARFLRFAASADALWNGNFRDLSGAVARMATLAGGGRITEPVVEEEISRLRDLWRSSATGDAEGRLEEVLGPVRASGLDLFDRAQLSAVVDVCRRSRSLSEAGRELYAASRAKKKTANDADRLKKYLARFGIEWSDLQTPR